MTMAHRYFTLIRSGAVFRMDVDDQAETLDTFQWDSKALTWLESDRLVGYLLQGDVDLDELDADEVARLIPDEFRQ